MAWSDLEKQAIGTFWGTGVTHHPAAPTAVQQNVTAVRRAVDMASLLETLPEEVSPKKNIYYIAPIGIALYLMSASSHSAYLYVEPQQ